MGNGQKGDGMSFAISQKGKPTHVVWTTEMRFRGIHKLDKREHMLECRTREQAEIIAARQGGEVVGLGEDAPLGDWSDWTGMRR